MRYSIPIGTEHSQKSQIDPEFESWPMGAGAAWFDYDRDGFLDLIVTNYVKFSFNDPIKCAVERHAQLLRTDGVPRHAALPCFTIIMMGLSPTSAQMPDLISLLDGRSVLSRLM